MDEAFFKKSDGAYVPGIHTRGPWSVESLHGRVLAGLCAHAIERDHGEEPFQVARFTIDMFRLPRIEPVQVATERIRSGRRIRVVTATVTARELEIARATAVMLRRGESGPGDVWSPPDWEVPAPEELAPQRPQVSGWIPMWETRPIAGAGFGTSVRKRVWTRETHPLIEGEPLTPFVRAAGSADLASPLANSGSQGLHYVNADITLYLHRMPVGEWIGYEVASHHAEAGIAVGDCTLYDLRGAIGKSSICAVANPRPPGGSD